MPEIVNKSEALAEDDETVKADRKRWNFRWCLKVDMVSIEQMCAGTESSKAQTFLFSDSQVQFRCSFI